MRRKIVCSRCEEKLRKLFPTESPYPGEHVKFVAGPAIMQCICDDCGQAINVGEKMCAFSSWADYGGRPYVEWEDVFIAMAAS